MRRMRSVLAGAAAAAMIAAGFLLPQGILALQDRQLSGRVDSYETAPVRFYSSRQVTDTLSLLTKPYRTRVLAPDYARLSVPQVRAAAQECLEGLAGAGLFAGEPQAFADCSAAPSLCYADGAGTLFAEEETELDTLVSSRLSAVIWDCTLTDGTASVQMTVDDATGKVTSVSCWLGGRDGTPAGLEEKWSRLRAFTDGCAAYFAAYYGLEPDGTEYGDYPDNAAVFLLTPEAELVTLRLTMSGSAFSVAPV